MWHECALSARASRPGLDRQHKAGAAADERGARAGLVGLRDSQ